MLFRSTAIRPRILATLDSDLNLIHLPVRVGKGADSDYMGTRVRTQLTPVDHGERAGLTAVEFKPVTLKLEGLSSSRKASLCREGPGMKNTQI